MRMGYELTVEQTQKLILTPELRQAIMVLQFSSLELSEYVDQVLQENPLLEYSDEESIGKEEETPCAEEGGEEWDWSDYFQDGADSTESFSGKSQENEKFNFENFLSKSPTLQELLYLQLQLMVDSSRDRQIGEFLIGHINDQGYLKTTVTEVSKYFGCSTRDVERVLQIIQDFDPPGVGARDLQECLLIQLKQLGYWSELTVKIINNCLKDIAAGKMMKIANNLGLSVIEVQRQADIIKSLNPKPGQKFGNNHSIRYIIPDVVVEKVAGDFVVLVNDLAIPRLTVNNTYQKLLRRELADTKTYHFIEDKLRSAVWLVKSIEQRRLTLFKVASCLVECQREFLQKGVSSLKPLNLKKVAQMVNLHESTVSRATSNKYMQTPQGIYEMKFFFNNALQTDSQEHIAVESIKNLIRKLVEREDPHRPLSDQKITEYLRKKGIKIARRTVAKYRGDLGIPPLAARKRY